MSYKDPEKQREAQRTLMRQRRAAAKGKPLSTEGHISPSASGESSPPDINTFVQASQTEPRPATQAIKSPGKWNDHKYQNVDGTPPKGFWTRFPGQNGRPCFNVEGYLCCYDLNFPVTWARTYCLSLPSGCNYSRKPSLFDAESS